MAHFHIPVKQCFNYKHVNSAVWLSSHVTAANTASITVTPRSRASTKDKNIYLTQDIHFRTISSWATKYPKKPLTHLFLFIFISPPVTGADLIWEINMVKWLLLKAAHLSNILIYPMNVQQNYNSHL